MTDVKIAMERIKEPDKKVDFDSTAYTKEPGDSTTSECWAISEWGNKKQVFWLSLTENV